MDLVRQYVEGLNHAIRAGSDVRTFINGASVPVIETAIDEEEGDLLITFL